MSSLDLPTYLKDGKTPFAPWKYKKIVEECFALVKECGFSYSDLMHVTPTERKYMLEFFNGDLERKRKAQEEFKEQREKKQRERKNNRNR